VAEFCSKDVWTGGSMRRLVIVVLSVAILALGSCASTKATRASLDDVFVRPETEPGFWRDAELAVTVRFTSEEELERQITIVRRDKGVSARVTEAIGEPVWLQLEHVDDVARVRTRSYDVSDSDLLTSLLARFSRIRTSPLPSSTELYLHPNTITIWATTRAANTRWSASLPPGHATPVWGQPDGENEVVTWGLEVARLVRDNAAP
jgi:hypothetical protein